MNISRDANSLPLPYSPTIKMNQPYFFFELCLYMSSIFRQIFYLFERESATIKIFATTNATIRFTIVEKKWRSTCIVVVDQIRKYCYSRKENIIFRI